MAMKKDKYTGEVTEDTSGFDASIEQALKSAQAGAVQNQNFDIAKQNNEGNIAKLRQDSVNATNIQTTNITDAGATARNNADIKMKTPYYQTEAEKNRSMTAGNNLDNSLKKETLPDLAASIKAGAKYSTVTKQAGTVDTVREALRNQTEVGGDGQIGVSPGDFLAAAEERRLRDPRLAIGANVSTDLSSFDKKKPKNSKFVSHF